MKHASIQKDWEAALIELREQGASPETFRERWESIFQTWDESISPLPMWFPDSRALNSSNIAQAIKASGNASFEAFHDWSTQSIDPFWESMIGRIGVRFQEQPNSIRGSLDVEQPRWLPGARYNIVESCFASSANDAIAIVLPDVHGGIRKVTYAELREMVGEVVGGLRRLGFEPGDRIAIVMPMNLESVAIFLGIVAAGCSAVSIADSFSASEIERRLELAEARTVFCTSQIRRGNKSLDLYRRIVESQAERAIVIETEANESVTSLRESDVPWSRFLKGNADHDWHIAGAQHVTGVLFSSGTTGDPKVIPWDQTTPLRCAIDGCLLQDIQAGDVVVWPTNLGWMMGPWLIYASLINGATVGLYPDVPVDSGFGQFIEQAGVTMLGVIPTLVRAWRASKIMEPYDWTAIRCFSSTGEASNADDMFYLSSLAGMRPVMEYCGGTEIGGGYISSTMVHANVASAFATPAPGQQLVILDEEHNSADAGTLFLVPPAMGLSTRLLNRDHHSTYFADCPSGPEGQTLRRHGDHFRKLPGGYFVAGGRVDDTMNLGGIKVSSAEIEKSLHGVDRVIELAAVAMTPTGGGPDELIVFAVLENHPSDNLDALLSEMNQRLRTGLNPLFKIKSIQEVEKLPRTASDKIMRRELRKLVAH